jgi:hypothetical protein
MWQAACPSRDSWPDSAESAEGQGKRMVEKKTPKMKEAIQILLKIKD